MRTMLALVVAVARNGVIGMGGTLPWRIPEDLRHFRRVTVGHAIIMGRKTWDSIGKPLPERRNIVVTRNPELKLAGAEVVPSLEAALSLAHERDEEPRIIGGAELYRLALPQTTRIFLTEVDREVEGDTFFPALNRAEWHEIERRPGEDPTVSYVILTRV